MIPTAFPPAPRVVVVCRSKTAARAAIAKQSAVPADHPQIRYALEPRDLLGCTDSMALLDLSEARLTPTPPEATIHLPYGRTRGGARFDRHAAQALRTLGMAQALRLQPITLSTLADHITKISQES